MNETTPTTIETRYLRMMDNIKRANKKYFEKNRQSLNAKCRQYYNDKFANNLEYKQKKKEYHKEKRKKKHHHHLIITFNHHHNNIIFPTKQLKDISTIIYTMVKSVTLWKREFFKNDDDNGGALHKALEHCKPTDQIVIHSQTQKYGRFWGCVEPSFFLKLLEINRGLYEVITHFPHKVYFDIDADNLITFIMILIILILIK
jgi:hypothetical protein